MDKERDYPFQSVEEEAKQHKPSRRLPEKPVSTYELAFLDQEFLLRPSLRSVRLQLEYLKAEMCHIEQRIESTIVVFGSARTLPQDQTAIALKEAEIYAQNHPEDSNAQHALKYAQMCYEKSFYYEEARRFAKIVSTSNQAKENGNFVISTGGGPGIMEGANRGAKEVHGRSIGLSIYLPTTEESSNPYITPELHLQFHYFAMRKMHFLNRARALIFFPGGFGTLDELFESLTLMQTKKMKRIPVILCGRKYWNKIINFQALVDECSISPEDLHLFQYVETAEEAWKIITDFYSVAS